MERYIGVDDVVKTIVGMCINKDGETIDIVEMLEKIEYLPTADVEEVRHGKWVYCWSDVRRCSCCGHEVTPAQADLYKGCPICRAKMKGR